jgi:hypothetical protein
MMALRIARLRRLHGLTYAHAKTLASLIYGEGD